MPASARLARRDEYATAARFIDEHWQANHVYCREPRLFDWTFGQNPYWTDDDHYSFSVAEYDGEVVGVLGIIPFALNHYNEVQSACWLVNWKVRDDRRSTGAGLALLKLFQDAGLVTISFSINDVIARLYRGLGWELVGNIPRMLWIPSDGLKRMQRLCELCNANVGIEQLQSLIDHGGQQKDVIANAPISLSEISAADWNRFGWLPYARSIAGCSREASYLHWRYLRHPLFTYRTAVISEAGRMGLAVWRVETIHQRGPTGLEPVDKIVRLVEFLPVSDLNAQALLSEVRRDAVAHNAIGIDFYCFHSDVNAILQNNGFVDLDQLPFGSQLPNRFQPLDNKGGTIKSAVKIGFPGPSTGHHSDWYWTRSDSDQDRPN